jgi:hypothetical protein
MYFHKSANVPESTEVAALDALKARLFPFDPNLTDGVDVKLSALFEKEDTGGSTFFWKGNARRL